MSKYFGKCFGPSTPASKSSFWLRCPSFILSKFASQLKLIQSVVRVKILGICVTSLIMRVLLSGFWVAISKSQGPISRFLGVRVPESPGPGFQSPWSQGLSVLGLRVPGSQGPGSRVAGPEFRLCHFQRVRWNAYLDKCMLCIYNVIVMENWSKNPIFMKLIKH